MAFKKKGNQEAVRKFLDLYYEPAQITRWIGAEGFLPVTTSGLRQMSGNPSSPRISPPCPREARAHHRSRVGPSQARRPADHRARRPARRQPEGDPRPAPEKCRRRRRRSLTGPQRRAAPGRGGGRSSGSVRSGAHRVHRAVPGRRSSSPRRSAATPPPASFRARWAGATTLGSLEQEALAGGGRRTPACGWPSWSRHPRSSRSGSPSSSIRALPRPPPRALGPHRPVGRLADHDLEAVRLDLRLLLRAPQPLCSSSAGSARHPVDWLGEDRR